MQKINKSIFVDFTKRLYPDSTPQVMGEILWSISRARSLRISSLSNEMAATAGSYKKIQRFLDRFDYQEALMRFFNPNAPFFIGDVTEIPRKEAYKTEWIGTLSDGETKGFWLLTLATPYHGRAMPFAIEIFSSSTINEEVLSKNLIYDKFFGQIKELVGNKPLIFDRELCGESYLKMLIHHQINFVIRLNMKGYIKDGEGKVLNEEFKRVPPGVARFYKGVYYKGIRVNVAVIRKKGEKEPIVVMSNLHPKTALAFYLKRMQIDETFRDGKEKLGLERVMNKKKENTKKMISLLWISFNIMLLIGRHLREGKDTAFRRKYSCLFVVLFLWGTFHQIERRKAVALALQEACRIAFHHVRSPV